MVYSQQFKNILNTLSEKSFPSNHFLFQKPYKVDDDWYELVLDGFLKYGLFVVSDFWEGYEQLISYLYEFGDYDYLFKISLSNITPLDIIDISETNSDINQDFHCSKFNMDLNIPCNFKKCQHYTKHTIHHCGYSDRNPSLISFEVIAHNLEISVEETVNLYTEAIKKLKKKDIIKDDFIQPLWDIAAVDGCCSLCGKVILEDDKFKKQDEYSVCNLCLMATGFTGIKLILQFKRPLKDIIGITSEKFHNFQSQAAALGVGVSVLQNLYNRVGINRRGSQASGRAYQLTKPRPGRTIINDHVEFLAMDRIAMRRVFGAYSEDIIKKVRQLNVSLKNLGIHYISPFIKQKLR